MKQIIASYSLKALLLSWCMLCALHLITDAQVNSYTFSATNSTYTPITGNVLFSGGWDDGASALLTLPFTFTYNNLPFSTLSVTANGFLTLGAVPSGTIYCGLQQSPPNSIAAYGTDLKNSNGTSDIRYATRGVAPNRQFVVQWFNCDHFNTGNVNSWTFQIILNETSNIVQVVYGLCTDVTVMGPNICSDAANESGNVGLLGSSSSDYNIRKITNGVDLWNSSQAGTQLSDVCNMSPTNVPASGLTYNWTPPPPTPMVFVSATTSFVNNLQTVPKGFANNPVIKLNVVTTGTLAPFQITNLSLATTGCSNPALDITGAKVYYTGSQNSFSSGTQFGSTVVSPNGNFIVTGSVSLNYGNNYFWLTYDIANGATLNDTLRACCNQVTGSGSMGTQVPVVSCPAGSQIVGEIGFWTPLATKAPDDNLGGMLLLSDGSVIAKTKAGGSDGIGSIYNRLTPDIHGSYVNGTWSSIAPMNDTRLYYSSQILMDGRVYVAGGEYGTGGAKGEVYNPLTDTWTPTPNQGQTFSDANSEILPDGRVLNALVNQGGPTATVIYNPLNNTYIPGPPTIGSHNESSWVKLADSSIIMIAIGSTSSSRYIPSLNQWIADATVPVNLYDIFGFETGAALLLPDGRAFFIGATSKTAYYTPSGNLTPGTWAAGPDIPDGKGQPDAPAAMMVNGKILMPVSPAPISGNVFQPPTTFYEFDYLSNTFTAIVAPGGGANINKPCYESNLLTLPDGNVLYGVFDSSQYYIYTPAGAPLAAGKPTISSVIQNGCNAFTLTGTLFNGISEGACYGDDWQMATNYPIVRVSSGGNVYYARSFNWNSTGVQRGTSADTTQFTLPVGLPSGSYYLQVIANGIASDSVLFNPYATLSSSLTPPPVCSGSIFAYSPASSTPGATFTWTRAAVAGISNPAVTIPQTTNPNEILINISNVPVNVVYDFVITVNGCNSNQQVTVVVFPATAYIVGDTTVCLGNSVTLSVLSGIGFSWSTGDTTSSITVSPTTGTTYSVTVTNANGCPSGTASQFVSVNPLPVVSFTGLSDTTCATAGNITLVGNPLGGSFTGAGISGSTFNPFNLNGTVAVTYSYTDNLGCTNIFSANSFINSVQVPVIAVTGDSIFCAGNSAVLSTSNFSSYLWSNGLTNDSISVNTSGIYVVTVADGNGCTSTASQIITVNALPLPVATANGPTTFCQNGSVQLITGSYVLYNWSNGAVSNPIVVNTQGIYNVIVTDANGCSGSSNSIAVVVNPLPAVSFSGLPDTVCAYNGNYSLTGTPAGGAFTGAGITGSVFNPAGVPFGANAISYSFTDGNGCQNSDVQNVFVSACTGIGEVIVADRSILIYPNPAIDKINIDFTSTEKGIISVKLIDLPGQLLMQQRCEVKKGRNPISMSLKGISRGVYLIEIQQQKQTYYARVIVQ
jgi:hypothetical protein